MLNLIKKQHNDIYNTIKHCYSLDPSLQQFSRNNECNVEERAEKEFNCLDKNMNFYRIYENNNLVGYFGTEGNVLSTFFIMPEYRKEKEQIWNFIISHMPEIFYAGLFDINTRAINFFLKNNAEILCKGFNENKPVTIFVFRR